MAANPSFSGLEATVEAALARANSNPSRNTYLWRDADWTRAEARRGSAGPLAGLAVSIKDCFDLAGAPTTLGIRQERQPLAAADSWLVEQLRAAGAVITGKTHLHPLAYGLTGENQDYGDCLQPADPSALTGGSSSGAAATVLEGSAAAAVGTDTGGSIRVPAALCGLAGYRASIDRGDWRGGAHLAETFDTFGWLFRDLEDGPRLGSLFGDTAATRDWPERFAVVHDEFLADCEPVIVQHLRQCQMELKSLGLRGVTVDVSWWNDSREIFAAIQAAEACRNHSHVHIKDVSIRQRLEWGASLSDAEIREWRVRHHEFRDRINALLREHQLLLLPATPVTRLAADVDHAPVRPRLLRYTTPVSLAGMPAVVIPYFQDQRPAGGMQLASARGDDARLLALAAALGRQQKSRRLA